MLYGKVVYLYFHRLQLYDTRTVFCKCNLVHFGGVNNDFCGSMNLAAHFYSVSPFFNFYQETYFISPIFHLFEKPCTHWISRHVLCSAGRPCYKSLSSLLSSYLIYLIDPLYPQLPIFYISFLDLFTPQYLSNNYLFM